MANKLLISAAGSGKTTLLVREALRLVDSHVLLLTYTEANEREIRERIIKARGSVPNNISIQTWFSFLLQHGVRPFQSALNNSIHEQRIGFYLNSDKSGQRLDSNGSPILAGGRPIYWGERDFLRHYFTSDLKIYADKISKFIVKTNDASGESVMQRLEAIFDHCFIDEVQDLAGYDLEVLSLLMRSRIDLTMVGDPRQVTYLTHNPTKHRQYSNGGIAKFITDKIPASVGCTIDETTLSESHRCHEVICHYANRLFPDLPASASCKCGPCNPDGPHLGVYVVQPRDVAVYLDRFDALQLRWNSTQVVNPDHPVMNMGESKGSTTDRVLIYPTLRMERWLWDNSADLSNIARAKLYVSITRARLSSAFVLSEVKSSRPEGLELFKVE